MKTSTITKIYLEKEEQIIQAIEFIEDNFFVKAYHLLNDFQDSFNKWKDVNSYKLYIEVTRINGGYNIITKVEKK